MVKGLEVEHRYLCVVWFVYHSVHYPQPLDIVQLMLRLTWHAVGALAMAAVVQWVDDGGGPRFGSGPSP